MEDFNNLLRVHLQSGRVHLEACGLDAKLCPLDLPCILEEQELPDWLARKLAILMVMPYEGSTTFIPNIGKRFEEGLFWVHYNEGDFNGTNT